MTILFITADRIARSTGAGLVCHHEMEALSSLGHELRVLSQPDLDPAHYQMPHSPFLVDYLALQSVSRWCETQVAPPSLAHFYSGTFSETVRHLKSLGVPVTYTVAAHSRDESIREFEALCGVYPFPCIKEPHIWNLYMDGIRRADVVIVPSRSSADEVGKEGCRQVEIIPHSADLPTGVPAHPDTFVVGYLGQIGPDKGLLYLIRAWDRLADSSATLFLAGDGSDQLAPLISANANHGRFELLGRVQHASDLYARISVYVQPSVTEGFGIEILEAMAHGRPVIVSEGAGGADVVTPGQDGFVVPRRDPDAIVERLRWFRDDPRRAAAMGVHAREKAERYAWRHIQAQYTRCWRALIG